jgi:predicted transposase YdaD
MRDSTMYQSILREGRAVEGRALVLKQLTRKLGTLSLEVTAKANALSLGEVEALLDFTKVEDLESWLG